MATRYCPKCGVGEVFTTSVNVQYSMSGWINDEGHIVGTVVDRNVQPIQQLECKCCGAKFQLVELLEAHVCHKCGKEIPPRMFYYHHPSGSEHLCAECVAQGKTLISDFYPGEKRMSIKVYPYAVTEREYLEYIEEIRKEEVAKRMRGLDGHKVGNGPVAKFVLPKDIEGLLNEAVVAQLMEYFEHVDGFLRNQ